MCEEDYLKRSLISGDQQVGVNDALAHLAMKEKGINKIDSFDKDSDTFKDIKRIFE